MRTGRPKQPLMLTNEERERLESLAHRARSQPLLARRARVVLHSSSTPKLPPAVNGLGSLLKRIVNVYSGAGLLDIGSSNEEISSSSNAASMHERHQFSLRRRVLLRALR